MQDNNKNSSKTSFEIRVAKDTFKFNASHFVAFDGFRERLHGHNYTVAVRLLGCHELGQDGYVLDFGDVKAVTKKVCKDLNEYFLCPMYSDVLTILDENNILCLECQDGAKFQFPTGDCRKLPIVHSTAEEMAIYVWGKIVKGLDVKLLRRRGIHTMEVTCAEAPGQEALFRMTIPENEDEIDDICDVRKYVSTSKSKMARPPCCY